MTHHPRSRHPLSITLTSGHCPPFQFMQGAALGLNANILPAFDQLGLLEELTKIAFPMSTLDLYHENLEHIGSMDISGFKTQ